jgi:hypothetical protein
MATGWSLLNGTHKTIRMSRALQLRVLNRKSPPDESARL